MPIHERGYTRWRSTGAAAEPAWWVIARRGLSRALRSRRLMLLLFVSWVPAVVKGVFIFVKGRTGQLVDLTQLGGKWTSITADGFLSFVEWQRFFVMLVMMILGAGLIARDRRDNGLALYFSRPLGLGDYLAGKSLIVLFGYLAVTLAPVFVLCLFAYLVDPGVAGLQILIATPLKLAFYCGLTGVSLSLMLLALSSMATREVLVVVWWAVLCLGGESIGGIGELLGLKSLQFANLLGHWHNAGTLVVGGEPRLPMSPWSSLGVCAAAVATSLWILRMRIRPVEVVA